MFIGALATRVLLSKVLKSWKPKSSTQRDTTSRLRVRDLPPSLLTCLTSIRLSWQQLLSLSPSTRLRSLLCFTNQRVEILRSSTSGSASPHSWMLQRYTLRFTSKASSHTNQSQPISMTQRTTHSFPRTEVTGALMKIMQQNTLMRSINTIFSRVSIPSSSSQNGMAAMSTGSTGSSVTITSDLRWLVAPHSKLSVFILT